LAIYEISSDKFRKIDETSFSSAGLRERQDLQRLLRSQIEIVSPDTLVIAEEFSQWEDSNRRIDLLGIDKDANLVVIELKRTEDGGHMDLQSIRYAAMVSAMTFERAVEVYTEFLKQIGSTENARTSILEFLEWNEPDEDRFAQDARIVLVAAEFSKELTTSVIWLNERGLDIECVRIKPYSDNGRILADVQQIIPLPEAEDYRVRLKEKQQRERAARKFNPDFTKYDVTVDEETHERLPKRTEGRQRGHPSSPGGLNQVAVARPLSQSLMEASVMAIMRQALRLGVPVRPPKRPTNTYWNPTSTGPDWT